MTNKSDGGWKKLSSKIVYQNPWIKIHEDQVIQPGGQKGIYGYLEKPAGVIIIALDSDENIYFVDEYRYVLKKTILQLPSGVVVDSLSPKENAQKELKEETGIIAKNWKDLGKFYIGPGHETTFMYAFLATDLDITKVEINQEEDESIQEIKKIPLAKVKKMTANNEIPCGLTIAALNIFFQKFDK